MTSTSGAPFSFKPGNIPLRTIRSSVKKWKTYGKEKKTTTLVYLLDAEAYHKRKRNRRDSFHSILKIPSLPYKYCKDSLRNKQTRRELHRQSCDKCDAFYAMLP